MIRQKIIAEEIAIIGIMHETNSSRREAKKLFDTFVARGIYKYIPQIGQYGFKVIN
ncbi:hypothetical protein [Streptococcus cuniculi]|uniref:hypothetical protein n=1 Tax=Streptococcus cuniculi TaxID=1432788 RepID=UPI001430AE27|nr:hypothetical protein [Streptococcus cuniculi]MBF0779374.1 hypothetical protein [Streptococcus cuniculi]